MIELGSLNIKVEGKELRTDKKDEMYFLLTTDVNINADFCIDAKTNEEYMIVHNPTDVLIKSLDTYKICKRSINKLFEIAREQNN